MTIKSFLLSFVWFLFFLYQGVAQKNFSKKLAGEWTWIEASGGFDGGISTPKTEGYTIRIAFTKKNIFKSYKDDVIHLEKKYKIILAKSIYSGENAYIIQYIHPPGQEMGMVNDLFEFKGNDTLVLKQNCADCYTRVFIRAKTNAKYFQVENK